MIINPDIAVVILNNLVNTIEKEYKNGCMEKFTLEVLYEDIMYEYALKQLNMDSDNAIQYSIDKFHEKVLDK